MTLSKTLAYVIGAIGLGLTIVPSMLAFSGTISQDQNKTLMAVGMVLWFLAAFRIMKRNG
ncbi:hypothetical protein [Telluribacter sp. SYSU D00476]|uniref:hypothetical protein n=1 Tax=Telluribacter sp. SYSU D00476 TaxID=2811430 RepID=UPI001FF6164E|nr:hypothetical protein [Telluribacter sp. SYSU D00476]